MALSFADAPGNLFNRLGKLGLLIKQVRAYQAALLPNMTDTTSGVVAQYNDESDIQAIMGSSYINLLNSLGGAIGSTAQTMAQLTVNRMVFRDNPRIAQTLQSVNLVDSLREIIRQMGAAGATVLAQTITMTPQTFNGVGNGVINGSAKRPLDGLVLENTLEESLLFTVVTDSYSGSAVAGNEVVEVTGTGSVNPFAFDWPLGSNVRVRIRAIDGNVDTGSGNYLTNSGFNAWTSNVPDNWTLEVGTAGVDILKEISNTYDGAAAIALVGDGATLTEIRQLFNDTDGTSVTLSPQSQYSVCVFARRDGTAAAAGVLEIDLVDGNGDTVQDANGVENAYTIDLTALTTTYTQYVAAFRTPIIMPDTLYIRIRLTTALTSGRTVYLDKLSLGDMTQLYTSGPFVAVHAGAVPFAINDYGYCDVTNSRGSGGTLNTFQTLMATLIPAMLSEELLLPSSSSPSISDTLIG